MCFKQYFSVFLRAKMHVTTIIMMLAVLPPASGAIQGEASVMRQICAASAANCRQLQLAFEARLAAAIARAATASDITHVPVSQRQGRAFVAGHTLSDLLSLYRDVFIQDAQPSLIEQAQEVINRLLAVAGELEIVPINELELKVQEMRRRVKAALSRKLRYGPLQKRPALHTKDIEAELGLLPNVQGLPTLIEEIRLLIQEAENSRLRSKNSLIRKLERLLAEVTEYRNSLIDELREGFKIERTIAGKYIPADYNTLVDLRTQLLTFLFGSALVPNAAADYYKGSGRALLLEIERYLKTHRAVSTRDARVIKELKIFLQDLQVLVAELAAGAESWLKTKADWQEYLLEKTNAILERLAKIGAQPQQPEMQSFIQVLSDLKDHVLTKMDLGRKIPADIERAKWALNKLKDVVSLPSGLAGNLSSAATSLMGTIGSYIGWSDNKVITLEDRTLLKDESYQLEKLNNEFAKIGRGVAQDTALDEGVLASLIVEAQSFIAHPTADVAEGLALYGELQEALGAYKTNVNAHRSTIDQAHEALRAVAEILEKKGAEEQVAVIDNEYNAKELVALTPAIEDKGPTPLSQLGALIERAQEIIDDPTRALNEGFVIRSQLKAALDTYKQSRGPLVAVIKAANTVLAELKSLTMSEINDTRSRR